MTVRRSLVALTQALHEGDGDDVRAATPNRAGWWQDAASDHPLMQWLVHLPGQAPATVIEHLDALWEKGLPIDWAPSPERRVQWAKNTVPSIHNPLVSAQALLKGRSQADARVALAHVGLVGWLLALGQPEAADHAARKGAPLTAAGPSGWDAWTVAARLGRFDWVERWLTDDSPAPLQPEDWVVACIQKLPDPRAYAALHRRTPAWTTPEGRALALGLPTHPRTVAGVKAWCERDPELWDVLHEGPENPLQRPAPSWWPFVLGDALDHGGRSAWLERVLAEPSTAAWLSRGVAGTSASLVEPQDQALTSSPHERLERRAVGLPPLQAVVHQAVHPIVRPWTSAQAHQELRATVRLARRLERAGARWWPRDQDGLDGISDAGLWLQTDRSTPNRRWFDRNPEFLAADPTTGRTPLWHLARWSKVERAQQWGLSWNAIDHAGQHVAARWLALQAMVQAPGIEQGQASFLAQARFDPWPLEAQAYGEPLYAWASNVPGVGPAVADQARGLTVGERTAAWRQDVLHERVKAAVRLEREGATPFAPLEVASTLAVLARRLVTVVPSPGAEPAFASWWSAVWKHAPSPSEVDRAWSEALSAAQAQGLSVLMRATPDSRLRQEWDRVLSAVPWETRVWDDGAVRTINRALGQLISRDDMRVDEDLASAIAPFSRWPQAALDAALLDAVSVNGTALADLEHGGWRELAQFWIDRGASWSGLTFAGDGVRAVLARHAQDGHHADDDVRQWPPLKAVCEALGLSEATPQVRGPAMGSRRL